MENYEPDFIVSSYNFDVNNVFYEELQKNFISRNLNNCYLETIISEVNYKGIVIDVRLIFQIYLNLILD
jgi:hypothetical protein